MEADTRPRGTRKRGGNASWCGKSRTMSTGGIGSERRRNHGSGDFGCLHFPYAGELRGPAVAVGVSFCPAHGEVREPGIASPALLFPRTTVSSHKKRTDPIWNNPDIIDPVFLPAVSPAAAIQVTGETPLRGGCIPIVGAAPRKVKKNRSTRPAEKQAGITGRFSTVGYALWAVCVIVFFVLVWYRCGTDAFFSVACALWP